MITSIRKHMKNRAFKVIMWLMVFSLVGGISIIPAIVNFFKKRELTGIAMVDNNEISLMEFRRNYIPLVQFIREAKRQYGEQANFILSLWGIDSSKKTDEFVLDKLVQEKVVQNAANKLNVSISKDYVEHKLQDPAFVRDNLGNLVPPQAIQNGRIDSALLTNYLERQGISAKEFDQMLYQILERELLFNIAQGAAYVSLNDLKAKYLEENVKRKFAIASFDLKTYLNAARENKLQDSEIEKYFADHKKEYQVPEKRSGKLWTFSADGYGVEVSDKDVEQYYNKHKSEFLVTPGQRKIKRILIKIDKDVTEVLANKKAQELSERIHEKPELFDEIAVQESQASEKGQELTIKRGEKDPLFEQAVFSINSPNEISSVVKTQEGFEIIKLLEVIPAKYKDLNEVKDQIKDKVKKEKFLKEFSSDAKRIVSQASDMPSLFDKYIKDKKAQTSELTSILKDNSQEANKLFNIAHVNDYAFYNTQDKGYIIELTSIEKSYLPKLNDIKDKVVEGLYDSIAREKLRDDLQKLKNIELNDFESAVKKAKGSLEYTEWVDPKDDASFKALSEKGMPIKEAFTLTKIGNKITNLSDEKGFVVALKDIEKLDENDFEKNKQKIEKQLYKSNGQEMTQSYIKSLEKQAKIEINEPLLKRVSTGI